MGAEIGKAFLRPRTIAIVGATAAAHKAGGRRWLSALRANTAGARLFPVNPTAAELGGHKVYPSLASIREPVDLAVVMVPSEHVRGVIDECARLDVGGVVVVSAGFAETGAEGAEAERTMVRHLRERGIRMLGPNSAGVYSAQGGLNTIGWDIPSGRIGLITQSGNIALTFTRQARLKGVGFSALLAIGNSADLKLSELVRVLLEDEETRVILVYCEGFAAGDGRALLDAIKSVPVKKPIVILKPGSTAAGRRAVQSHTGSLAGDDRVAQAAFASAGIYRAVQVEEAFDVAIALSTGKGGLGNRIAVLSDGGGHATVVADAAGRLGLQLASFKDATRSILVNLLPVRSGISNPVDFAGLAESSPDCVPAVVQACLDDSNVDAIVLAGHFGGYHLMTDDPTAQAATKAAEIEASRTLGRLVQLATKPLIVHTEHADSKLETLAPLREVGVPILSKLENTAFAAAALCPITEAALDVGENNAAESGALDEAEGRTLLAQWGMSLPPHRVAQSPDEAGSALATLGGKIAMKLLSERAIHRTEVGGVVLDIEGVDEAKAAFAELMQKGRTLGDAVPRALAVPMAAKGIECIVGIVCDKQFGPAVIFGAGGVLVELIDDIALALAPISEQAAEALVHRTKVGKLLQGYRVSSRNDVKALYKMLAQVSEVAWTHRSQLSAIDLNPVIVNELGATAVDVRVVLAR